MRTLTTLLLLVAGMYFISSCTKEVKLTPNIGKVAPDSAAGGALLTVTGSDLRNVEGIVFDLGNVPVAFNPNFNTDEAILFRVPTDANVGDQHIVFTTTTGYQFSLPFRVLAVPSLVSAFPQEWEAGGTVTITGNYLLTVNHVAIVGSSDTGTIISKDTKQLVITLPATDQGKVKLAITNSAGTSITPFSLINMDQQLKFFTEGLGSGMQDWSWTIDHEVSNDPNFAVASNMSWKQLYAKGGWQGASVHSDNVISISDYTTLSFYVLGGTEDNTLDVAPDAIISGTGKTVKVFVPANVWTYVNIPVIGNYDGVTCQRFNFQIEGNNDADQLLYFDNVLLVH